MKLKNTPETFEEFLRRKISESEREIVTLEAFHKLKTSTHIFGTLEKERLDLQILKVMLVRYDEYRRRQG